MQRSIYHWANGKASKPLNFNRTMSSWTIAWWKMVNCIQLVPHLALQKPSPHYIMTFIIIV
jgi:hypothetical protein